MTAPTSTSYTTVFSTTVTVTSTGACQLKKRVALATTTTTSSSKSLPPGLPSALSAFRSSYISSACQCLQLSTPTFTPTTTITPLTTTVPLTTTTTVPTNTVTPAPTTVNPSTTVTTTTASTVTVPAVVLSSRTPITLVNASGFSLRPYDDQYFTVALPFAASLFGASTKTVQVSVNGFIAVAGAVSYDYINSPLVVSSQDMIEGLPDTCFVPYWTNLLIAPSTRQGLYYQVYGSTPSRRVAFEWYTYSVGVKNNYHFIATLEEDVPGKVTYDYYEITPTAPRTDRGNLGTVGVQQYSTHQYAQYSFNNAAPIYPGLRVVYDPASNTFTSGTRGSNTCGA